LKKGIIIQGSSNSYGETHKIVTYVSQRTEYSIIDLKNKKISQFDYEFNNRNDDFHPLIENIAENYDIIIFATPVYWYTMTGIMKKFFDRFSDCLKIEKDTGRKLRGKEMAVISCGSDKILKKGFHMPFVETANYLGMKYIVDIHTWIESDEIPEELQPKLQDFIEKIS